MTRWEKWLNTIRGWFSPLWEGVLNLIVWSLSGVFKLTLDALEQSFAPMFKPIVDSARATGKVPPELNGLLGELENPTEFGAAFLGQAAAAGATGGIISSTIGPWLLLLQYEIQRGANQYRFDPMTALAISVRRPDLAGLVDSDIRDQGMTRERFDALFDAALTRLKEDDYVLMRRRFGWTEAQYLAAMKDLGYTPERAADFYQTREYYPTPQDLVRWQAREVFEPEMIARYGLDDELGGIQREPFHKAGMTEEQITNYWRAHWEHASWNQVQEMLFRGLLTIDQVRDWFRLVEIPPFWRDRLIASAYRPLTRVDVRRMHKVGTLDRQGVYDSYRIYGYNHENATLMTDFTLGYNEVDERMLTKSDILSSLRKDIIVESAARDMLAVLGYVPEDIDILLAEPAPGAVEAERKLTLSQLRQLYERNLRPWAEIAPFLAAMGFEPESISSIKAMWDWNKPTEVKERTRDLTLAQIRQQYEKGLRARSQITPFLATMGYSAAEISAMFELWDWEKPIGIKEATRELTLTHVRQLYELGLRQRTEVEAWLRAMGYSAAELAAILDIWDWEAPPRVRQPSRADLDRFLVDLVIDFWTWGAEYRALGYSDRYIDWYYLDLLARGKVE